MSGTPINTPFFIMGTGGISSVQPGNMTGLPNLGSVPLTSSNGGSGLIINVGSGTNDATALNIPPVTRNSLGNDLLNPMPLIGGQPSGDNSPILPPGQSYRATTSAISPTNATAAGTTRTGQTTTSPPSSGVESNPPSPYPPSVVPLVFPFKPAGSSMFPPGSPAPGPQPAGPTPSLPTPPQQGRPAGPNEGDQE